MTTNISRREISSALSIISQIMPLLNDAEKQFTSAKNWGFLDILGGGILVDIVKHTKLGKAASKMNQINYLLHDLQRELKDIQLPTDYSMNTVTFATFADFLFDGILADAYMQSKIMSSLEQVRELKRRLEILHSRLTQLLDS